MGAFVILCLELSPERTRIMRPEAASVGDKGARTIEMTKDMVAHIVHYGDLVFESKNGVAIEGHVRRSPLDRTHGKNVRKPYQQFVANVHAIRKGVADHQGNI